MRRFSLWLRGKPVVADSILAFGLLMLDLTGIGESNHKVVYLVVAGLLPLPVAMRRLFPRAMAATLLGMSMLVTLLGYVLDDSAMHPALIALGIMLYTLVAYVGRREAALLLIGLGVDAALAMWLVPELWSWSTPMLVGLIYALCWTLAEFNGARHAYDAEVAARLAVADYDRERRTHEAVAQERTRIARELHDVVAHAVSVIIVQADGAKYALRRDPDIAEQALATIASTGRDALRELRRTVALLRTEHAPDQLPQHGTAGIARVVDMMRGTGLAVELELTGDIDDIAPEVSLGVHRIVQEALTNTLRHAGAHPKAWVRVQRRDDDVLVEVIDSGGVPVHGPELNPIKGSGLGLLGMRERTAVLGGTLHAGRTADGAWRVLATIPLDQGARE
ncbi:sensor histidine kinase [Nocardia puris]|uniref:histidine kinase n=1 Tax=Nocardia puris TaxID=208602 RepID=A0A366DVY0_9NOCA|nr:histidine kinase [Nocardia puris]MBF6210011.1 sensor histidine kinase [Nocardia puris]MBF6368202.1 sensor histidine kinase [Nocardia puris]MBF6458079.1 sensor histidine kinase [Nocardia puris]RBO94243.1 signal transduction histidine kinase [Nocardia puris]